MRGQCKTSVVGRISRFVPLAMIVLAAGCVPAESPGPSIGAGGARPSAAAKPRASLQAGATVVVRQGDSLYKIARRHGVELRDLIELNRARPPYYIYKGQRIRLPKRRVHLVQKGETLYGVSRRHGVDMAELVRVNKIAPPYRITVGSRLRLPSTARRTARAAESAARGARSKAPATDRALRRTPSRIALRRLPPRAGGRFLWPVQGRVIVGFGPREGGLHNDGINILARAGTAVRAADNGRVAYSGNELRGFGNLLLVKHAGGWMSAYAHNARLLVRVGQKVRRGQTIARVGATGSVRRPQLHFELRRGIRVVNPIKHLQRRRAGVPPVAPFGTVRPIASLGAPPDPG
jgi:murein DD-endopeptidase MepM/ murein hydrolase activator NlpD